MAANGHKQRDTLLRGVSVEETTTILMVSQDSVLRNWTLARAGLLAELKKSG